MTITKDTPGIRIDLECLLEDTGIEGNVPDETATWIKSELARGNDWAWSCAHVRVTYTDEDGNATIGDDYLGCCSYRSEEEFRADGYFEQMVDECISQINRELSRKPCPTCGQLAYPDQTR